MKNKRLTIRDIAKLAGVSKTTVSRYINGKYDMLSEKSLKKVEEVIKEYNYIPNNLARGLATKSTQTIGVVIADITNPFSSVMINGIDDECKKQGYRMLFANSNNDSEKEMQTINKLLQNSVDGLIINTTGDNDEFLENLDTNHVVLIDRLMEKEIFTSVTSDNYNSTYEMISRLYNEYKYEEIYFISESLDNISSRTVRFQAFSDALNLHLRLNGEQFHIIHESSDYKSFEQRIVEISKHTKKTAFFTVNGVVLKTLLTVLKESNISFPEDVGVSSYEYWDWTDLIGSGVTSIAQNSYEMGRISAEILINEIQNKATEGVESKTVIIPNKLLIRGSV